ncbi:MAG: hypothetical protein ABSF09_11440 [Candidatus Bathyarchaeia archaeon]|jgi:hypothetical protein
MAQSTLLDSTKEKAGKFSVSVERVVNLGNYETLRIGLAEVLDLASEKPEDAYARIMQKVDGWTSQLKPATVPVTKAEPAKPTTPQPSRSPNSIVTTNTTREPTIDKEDPYLALPWKQSQKKQNLGTILVTPKLLENPLARDLYDKLKEWKSRRVGPVSYRYSKMENGTEFLQKWSPSKLG